MYLCKRVPDSRPILYDVHPLMNYAGRQKRDWAGPSDSLLLSLGWVVATSSGDDYLRARKPRSGMSEPSDNSECLGGPPNTEVSADSSHLGAPASFDDLFELYYDRYKPLYSYIQTFNEMPVELVFEVAAAWDHVSRHWKYAEAENECIDKAGRHIKRAILDGFKLVLKYVVDDYNDLRRVDTSLIDNGDFDRRMRGLVADVRQTATRARTSEGDTAGQGAWGNAFLLWDDVFQKCEQLRREFILSEHVDWARRKQAALAWRRRVEGFVIGILSSGVVALTVWWLL